MFNKIVNFKNYTLVQEARLFIWAKPFRIDDLFNSGFFKEVDIFNWMRKYQFDRWAVGVLVSKNQLKKKSTFKRFPDRSPVKSEFGDLLDKGDIDSIEAYRKDFSDKDLKDKIDDLKLRLSGKGVKGENYFDDTKQIGKGSIIQESKFIYEGDEIYLYIFENNSNSSKRARQLNGIIYESEVKRMAKLDHSPKGERWDAIGSLDSSYLDNKVNSGAKIYLNGDTESDLLNDYNLIPQDFLQPNNNWSIKSCSDSKNASIYLADFKRISGLNLVGNPGEYTLHLIDKNLDNFILVVGLHTKGQFTKEYIINVKLENWRKLIPDVSNRGVINKLEEMYNNLEQHRLGSKSNPGKRTDETELAWREYCATYRKITENYGIKLNFKRDTKGQLRIQCSMSKSVFYNELLKNNDYILIKY
jgi:hypothetical protein